VALGTIGLNLSEQNCLLREKGAEPGFQSGGASPVRIGGGWNNVYGKGSRSRKGEILGGRYREGFS